MGCEPEIEISMLIPAWEQHVDCCHVLTQHYTKIETAQLVRPLCVHDPGPCFQLQGYIHRIGFNMVHLSVQ